MNTKLIFGAAVAVTLVTVFMAFNPQNQRVSYESISKFNEFKMQYNKSYDSLEDHKYRLGVFADNLKKIQQHNAKETETYTLGINQFADMTFEEFKAKYLGTMVGDDPAANCEQQTTRVGDRVESVDWNKAGRVQKVKNQAMCGSCWAFSTVGALESAYAIRDGVEPPNLSEQELVDCSKSYGNMGCNGGLMSFGYSYINDHGLNTQKAYPYMGRDGHCDTDKIGEGKYGLKSCVKVTPTTDGLVDAAAVNPVAVAFHVSTLFQFYTGGVYDPWWCKGEPNHGVVVTGYNLGGNKPYFIVKNSWGKTWGESGYFRIAIGKKPEGVCKIAGSGANYYPVV